ncbi:hypothetical protein [Mycolicibacterium grossiae]|uniref:hypothetical protein n=1 Tax=Mycolicibacterium grossiae TaxID=1552759 RepID=UPI000F7A468D|nr:hypothetical protein [Mycolicibacterium grossiae]QEM47759.1 hypothetical protein FZ046_26045 [Mycolicibacterium grossiae]
MADAQALAPPGDYFSNLVEWWQPIFLPSASRPVPTPPSGIGPTPQSLPDTLEWAYHAAEPWVRYGFELATYAAGWVPYVGWLSGQIMIGYNFGERIVHAVAHNTLDWLNGNGSLLQNVADGAWWTVDAFIQLAIDEWNFFLPPLPPLPPLPFVAEAGAALDALRAAVLTGVVGFLESVAANLPSRPDESPAVAMVADTNAAMTEATDGDGAPQLAMSVTESTTDAHTVPAGAERLGDGLGRAGSTGSVPDPAAPEFDAEVPEGSPAAYSAGATATSSVDEAEPTTTSSGGVQAQGEVRGSVTAPAVTTPGDAGDAGDAKVGDATAADATPVGHEVTTPSGTGSAGAVGSAGGAASAGAAASDGGADSND